MIAAALLGAALACSDPAPRNTGGASRTATPDAARDAEVLGRSVLDLLDQAAGYRSSHRGRLPASVAQLGIDSLAPEVVRRLRTRNDSAVAQVAFRRPAEHALAWCEASSAALEEASLNAGAFGVWCRTTGGTADSFTVGNP